MRTPTRLTRLTLTLSLCIAATACGGKSLNADDSPGAGNAVTNEAPAGDLANTVIGEVKTDQSLFDKVPNTIKDGGLKVATAEGYPPMEMFDDDGKTMIGVDMSLARALGNLMGVEVQISNSDVSAMIPGVVSGRYDVLMSGFNDTSERREEVSFVDYAKSNGAFMVPNGNPEGIETPADLCGKTMAVLDNGYYMDIAKGYSDECVEDGQNAIEVLGFADDPQALLQVKGGRAAAGMNDFPVAAFRAKTDTSLEAIEVPGDALFGMAVAPGNEELLHLLQEAMQTLMDDGSYSKILAAWGVDQMAIPAATINQGK